MAHDVQGGMGVALLAKGAPSSAQTSRDRTPLHRSRPLVKEDSPWLAFGANTPQGACQVRFREGQHYLQTHLAVLPPLVEFGALPLPPCCPAALQSSLASLLHSLHHVRFAVFDPRAPPRF